MATMTDDQIVQMAIKAMTGVIDLYAPTYERAPDHGFAGRSVAFDLRNNIGPQIVGDIRRALDEAKLSGGSGHKADATPAPGDDLVERCSDCPPVGYPTDKTRCAPCDRRVIADGLVEGLKDNNWGTNVTDTLQRWSRERSEAAARITADAAVIAEKDAEFAKLTGEVEHQMKKRREQYDRATAAEARITDLQADPTPKMLRDAYAASDLICPTTFKIEDEMLGAYRFLRAALNAGERDEQG